MKLHFYGSVIVLLIYYAGLLPVNSVSFDEDTSLTAQQAQILSKVLTLTKAFKKINKNARFIIFHVYIYYSFEIGLVPGCPISTCPRIFIW